MAVVSVLPAVPSWALTWIEYWPGGLADLSFRQRVVPLTLAEAHLLLLRNRVSTPGLDAGADDKHVLDHLRARLDAELSALGSATFVRLGSCSAKDTPLGVLTSSRVDSGVAALRLLTDGSRRITFDLRRALANGLSPRVYLREWRDIPWWSEFRCFLDRGRLAGISQYYVGQPMPEEALSNITAIRRSIETLVARVVKVWGDDSVVADVIATGHGEATLIEVNPWGPVTDAALFSWDARDFDGGMRVRTDTVPAQASWF